MTDQCNFYTVGMYMSASECRFLFFFNLGSWFVLFLTVTNEFTLELSLSSRYSGFKMTLSKIGTYFVIVTISH